MKHVGKMKNNSARVAVVYRTLPGEPNSALVVGTQGLADSYHDSLMSLLENPQAQQTNELAEILAVRKFPDGSVMLGYLHTHNHLKKVPTNTVLMTPNSQVSIPLDELNKLIAEQQGVNLSDLAVNDGNSSQSSRKKTASVKVDAPVETIELTPSEMRSRADALYKEAAQLRKEADLLDPPSKRKKSPSVNVDQE